MTHKFADAAMLQALAAPTPKEEIKTRPGRGGSGDLSYIDARFVFDRFDTTLGPELWQVRIDWTPVVHTPERKSRNGNVIEPEWASSYPSAAIGVLCEDGWVWKQDIGVFSDIEGVKGSVSDSIKRTAVQWGPGRDLYDPDSEARSGPQQAEQAHQAEQAVVGQTGLTEKQRGKLFAALREAGVEGDQRKALVYLTVNKHSVKNMTGEDLDKVLAVLAAPRSENPDVWENVELVQGSK
jgi:hypothetical protein